MEMVPTFLEKLYRYRQLTNKNVAAFHRIYHILFRHVSHDYKIKRNKRT